MLSFGDCAGFPYVMGSPMPGVGSSFIFVRISYPLFPGLTKKICLLVPLQLLSPLADRYWGYFSQCCFQHQMGSGTGLGCATPRVQENPVTWGARSAPEDPVGNVEMRFFSTQSLLSPVCISHLEIQASLKKKKKIFFFAASVLVQLLRQNGGIIQLLTALRGLESHTLHCLP